MSLLVPPIGWATGGTFAHLVTTGASGPASTIFFGGAPFGAPNPARTVIVAVSATGTGGTLKQLATSGNEIGDDLSPGYTRYNFDGSNQAIVAFLTGTPSGSSGTVKVTFTGLVGFCAISIYRAVGLSSPTPADTGGTANTATSFPANIDVTADSLVLGAFSVWGTSVSPTWSGLEKAGFDIDNGATSHSFADFRSTAAETPRMAGVTIGSTRDAVSLTAAWTFA